MTSLANAIIAYAFLKHANQGTYPVGLMFLVAACFDVLIALTIAMVI